MTDFVESTRVDGRGSDPAYLIVHRGDARLEVVDVSVGGRFTVGRAHANRIVLPDAKCSRIHCEIFNRGNQWYVRDLASRNGVTIDGNRLENGDHPLEFGDMIGVGSCCLLFTDRPEVDSRSMRCPPRKKDEDGFEIIERKSGTQYDVLDGVARSSRSLDDATSLFRIARVLAAGTTEAQLCQTVLEELALHTGASLGGILMLPPGEKEEALEKLELRASLGPRSASEYSTFLTRIALKDHDAILAHDISQHASLSQQKSLHEIQAESAICAPIRRAGEVLGVIHLYAVRGEASLTQSGLEFVLAVADQMGDMLYGLRQKQELEAGLDLVRQQVVVLQDQLEVGSELVGQSPKLEELRRAIARVAPTDALVLIRGESGVGKELVARAVHFNSHRKNGPFVCVNCAALTESLLESELFGHEKGAFTGASSRRSGKFEQANGGTLFLDEIGEMSPEIQAKFLRVLEGQAFERVGGGEPIMVDVRVVTATNRDLEEAVREKRFRRDLFFRLQVIEIIVPPLRQHPADIGPIAQYFLNRFATQAHRRIHGFTPQAIQKLQRHDWPGNVRELRNVVERAVILGDQELLGPEDIVLTQLRLDNDQGEVPLSADALPTVTFESGPEYVHDMWGPFIQKATTLDELDRLYIEAVLKSTDWNKSKASRILQIERTTLDRRLKKYGIGRPGGDFDQEDESHGSPSDTEFSDNERSQSMRS